jgi:hypothetical protein
MHDRRQGIFNRTIKTKLFMNTAEKIFLIVVAFSFGIAIILALNGISKHNEKNE